jgi:hypothetical protein
MSGQCNGLANAPYPGSGVNQPCAFNDLRFLWDDQTSGNSAWVISGGDTVIIGGGPWRVGWDAASGQGAGNTWCNGSANGNSGCYNPTIPAGTAGQHTRILGQNYASCSTGNTTNNSSLTQIFGGFGVGEAINLAGAKYVDLECLEITRHSQCIARSSVYNGAGWHDPMQLNPGTSMCGAGDDTDSDGIVTDQNMHDITMQDLWIHGHASAGLQGPIGGLVTMKRVNISFNGMAGWNFSDSSASGDTPNAPSAAVNASYVTMTGNGCFQEYPIVHTQFPAVACYDLYSGGFGDSWSGQDTDFASFSCDHCVQNYNTKDGFIGPHAHITNLSITNSSAYGNMGEQWKWGAADMSNGPSTWVFENNLAVGNCTRMSEALPGAASNYNAFLTDFCRASGDTFSVASSPVTTVTFDNNSIASYSDVVFDLPCVTNTCTYTPSALSCNSGSCTPGAGTTWNLHNNIILSLLSTNCQVAPNASQGCGGNSGTEQANIFYGVDSSMTFGGDHNIYYNDRAGCQVGNPNIPGGTCVDPLFSGEPSTTITSESQLDNFNFALSSGSPARGAGISISGLTTNYLGASVSNPPDIGAY